MSDPFASAKEKIRWAKKHLKVFDEVSKGFLKRDPFGFTRHFDPKGFNQVLRLAIRESPPPDLPLIAGDILRNARSALDNAVYGLAVENCPTLTDTERGRLQFPIVRDPSEFKEQKRRRRLLGVPAKQRTEIHRLQPYHGGWPQVWLRVLSDLDNTDKHRSVHVVASAVQWAGLGGVDGHDINVEWAPDPFLKEAGAKIVTLSLDPPKAYVEVEFAPEWILAIENGQIPGAQVVESGYDLLEHIVSAVEEAIRYLEEGRPDYLRGI
jgi:hypothetical protein